MNHRRIKEAGRSESSLCFYLPREILSAGWVDGFRSFRSQFLSNKPSHKISILMAIFQHARFCPRHDCESIPSARIRRVPRASTYCVNVAVASGFWVDAMIRVITLSRNKFPATRSPASFCRCLLVGLNICRVLANWVRCFRTRCFRFTKRHCYASVLFRSVDMLFSFDEFHFRLSFIALPCDRFSLMIYELWCEILKFFTRLDGLFDQTQLKRNFSLLSLLRDIFQRTQFRPLNLSKSS